MFPNLKLQLYYTKQNEIRTPCDSDGKASSCNAGDPGSIPGLGRSLEEGNGNPLHYSYLENSMDRGAWWATVPGIARVHSVVKSWPQLSTLA